MTSKVVKMKKIQVKSRAKEKRREYEEESAEKVGGGKEKGMALENGQKEDRARLGLNQSELGKKSGVSRQTISLIERGDYSPSVTLALKLAKIFDVKVEDIFSYSEDEV